MEYLLLAFIGASALGFLALLVLSVRVARREQDQWLRRLWIVIAIASGAFALASSERALLQAEAMDLIPESTWTVAIGDLQLIQSGIVFGLTVLAFIILGRHARSLDTSDRLARSLLDRVSHLDPKQLKLTHRESEVLNLIGKGVSADSELAAELHIAASTVQTHVKSLLRKTDLNHRSDLVAVAILMNHAGNKPPREGS